MSDRLIEKLAMMDARRELLARRLSLEEALEILADLGEAGDGIEANRWRDHVMAAHKRGDFRFTHELTRREWAAVRFGRYLPVWSLPEITAAMNRLRLNDGATWTRDAKPDPVRDAVYADIKAASREGRVISGPGGAAIPFRRAADPLRDETPEDVDAEIGRKLTVAATVVRINEKIDTALERAASKLTSGELVMSSVDTWRLLERTINEVAKTPSGDLGFPGPAVRFTDPSVFPRWDELLRVYTEAWAKAGSGANRAVELMRSLDAVWAREDGEAAALSEKLTGSPEPLPAELLAVERGFGAGVKVPRAVVEIR